MKFIGRAAEIETLDRAWRSPRSEFLPIYGRRRVGKTELILQVLKGRAGIYYMGKEAPEAVQVREFLQAAAESLGQPLLAQLRAEDWRSALEAVTGVLPGDSKLILALDEFQWIAQSCPSLPGILQEFWDHRWKRGKRIVLILCGSYIGFMEREVLGKASPLYGRRTGQILLAPLSYREAADFHSGYSVEDRARAYYLCGGIPYYLELLEPGDSIPVSIRKQFLSPHAPLAREPEFLLREELREVENYFAILMAIAGGAPTQKQIAKDTGIPDRNIYYYLQQLIGLRYVARRYPLISRKPAARSVRFVIEDPVLRFWFRFVFPNLSRITREGAGLAFESVVKPGLEAYFGGCFERLCREALPFLHQEEGITAGAAVGSYWSAEVQIDLVGLREDDWIDLGECKWGTVRSLPKVAAELQDKTILYPNPRNATLQRRIFLRKKPARVAAPEGVRIHGLDDLYL